MKIKLTQQQRIIITITTLLLIIGLCFIFRRSNNKPISPKTVNYDNFQTYEQKLEHWKSQCDFKTGFYTGEQIRNKLGRSDRIIYCFDCDSIINQKWPGGINNKGIIKPTLNEEGLFILKYFYNIGYVFDEWYIGTISATKPSNMISLNSNENLISVGGNVGSDKIKFNTYVDRTPPPQPPKNQPPTP